MSRVINKDEFTGIALGRINALWDFMEEKGHQLEEESPGKYFITENGVIMGEFETRRDEDGKAVEFPVTMSKSQLSTWIGEQLIEANS